MDLLTDTQAPGGMIYTDYFTNGTLQAVTNYPTLPFGIRKIFSGTKDGKFVKGQFRLNPVYINTVQSECIPATFDTGPIPQWGRRVFSGDIMAHRFGTLGCLTRIPGDHVLDESMVDVALQRAYGNVRKPDFDGQLFLGELSETLAMLSNPLKGLLKALRQGKNARYLRQSLSSMSDLTADGWLQYIYGIKPLIDDVTTIYLLTQRKLARAALLRAGGNAFERETQYSETIQDYFGGCTAQMLLSGVSRKSYTAKIYFNVRWGYEEQSCLQTWGFNPLSLPSTLWQTVPCSFVADWFFMIGPWLKSMIPHPDLDELGNCVSEKLETVYKLSLLNGSFTSGTPTTTVPIQYGMGEFSYSDRRLIRVVNRPIPLAPCWGPGLRNLSQQVAAGFLSWQRLPKLKR